jgi:hypothetical protein
LDGFNSRAPTGLNRKWQFKTRQSTEQWQEQNNQVVFFRLDSGATTLHAQACLEINDHAASEQSCPHSRTTVLTEPNWLELQGTSWQDEPFLENFRHGPSTKR